MSTENIIESEIKVSVVMPIYNAGEYLARAIGDVLKQTLTDIELICVDDGSTDNSSAIIERFKKKDGRIISLRQNNAGPSVARNKGLELVRGKYVIFLDADDMYEPTLLQSLYELSERDNLDVAVTRFDIYNDTDGKYTIPQDEPHSSIFAPDRVTSKNEHPDYILSSTTGYVWNKLIRTSFLHDKKICFDIDLYVFEDVHFVCSVMSLAERVERIEGILIHHRVYSEQSRAILFRKYYGQVPIVYKKIREFLMHHGMYIPLKKGYLNFSAGRCYKLYNLLWADGKERLWNMLHDSYVAELDWLNHDKSEFESTEVCEFVANTALYSYQEHLEREEKGKNIDLEQLDKELINKQVDKKHKGEHRRAVWHRILDIINIFKKKK